MERAGALPGDRLPDTRGPRGAEPDNRPGRHHLVRRAEGIEHVLQLSVLTDVGLADDAALAAAGCEPVLLDAVDRAMGWGRARRKTEAD
ncbi:hypothetical protein GCM10009574_078340 [Streptomyces asiaticus]|uniref:Uncharacterized protein n=2 Tax=Streptomyces rhizosphaericus TaxID=114699 RepID=A0ABP4CQR4_9ACTN